MSTMQTKDTNSPPSSPITDKDYTNYSDYSSFKPTSDLQLGFGETESFDTSTPLTKETEEADKTTSDGLVSERSEKVIENVITPSILFLDYAVRSAIYSPPKHSYLSPQAEAVASFVGQVGRDIAFTLTGYGTVEAVVKGLSGLRWLSTTAKLISKLPSPLVEGAKGAAAGVVKTGLDKAINPDVGSYQAAITAAELGGGDFSRELTNIALRKLPMNPMLKELAAYSADVVGGAAVALGIHRDIDDFTKEVIAPQAVAMGVVDLLLFGAKTGKLKLPEEDIGSIKENLEIGNVSPEGAMYQLKDITAKEGITPEKIEELKQDYNKAVKTELDKTASVAEVAKAAEAAQAAKAAEQSHQPQQSQLQPETLISPSPSIETPEKAKAVSDYVKKLPIDADAKIPLVKPPKDAVNTYRIDSDPETVNTVLEMARTIEETYGKQKKTFSEVEAKAKEVNTTNGKLTVDDILNQIGLDVSESGKLAAALETAPEQVLRYRNLTVDLGYATQHYAKKLAAADNVDKVDKARFIQFLNIYHDLTYNLDNISQRVAQTLSIFRVEANGVYKDLSEVDWNDAVKSVDVKATVEAADAIDDTDFKKLIEEVANADTIADLTKTVTKDSKLKRLIDFLVDYKAINVLTNFNTHQRNVLSQTTHMLWDLGIDWMAALDNTVLRGNKADRVTISQAWAKTVGNFEGIFKGVFKPAVTVKDINGVLHGKSAVSGKDVVMMVMFDPQKFNKLVSMTQIEGSRMSIENIGKGANWETLFGEVGNKETLLDFMRKMTNWSLGQMKTFSYGALKVTDQPFAYAGYYSEVRQHYQRLVETKKITKQELKPLLKKTEDYRTAKMIAPAIYKYAKVDKGLIGEEADRFVKIMLEKKGLDNTAINAYFVTKDGNAKIGDKEIETIVEADSVGVAKAARMTFKDDLEWTINKEIEGVLNKHKPLKLIQLFYHTPARIIEWGTRSTGLTPYYWERAFKSKNPVEKQRAIGALYMSGLVWAVGVTKYLQGELTPTWRTAEERKRFNEAGVLENAIKVGDTWININTLDPVISYTFTTIANLSRAIEESEDPKQDKDAEEIFADAFMILSNNLLNKTWSQPLSDFLDAIQGQGTAKYINSFTRSLIPGYGFRSFYNQQFNERLIDINGRILKGSYTLDSYGKFIPQWDYRFGLRTSKESERTSPIRKELARLGYNIPRMSTVVEGIELNDKTHYAMIRSLDKMFHLEDVLNTIVTSEAYSQLTDAQKINLIDKNVRDVQNNARNYIKTILLQQGKLTEHKQKKMEEYFDTTRKNIRWIKDTEVK